MARYGQETKDRLVARMLPPESATAEQLSREVGIGAQTLERWLSDALSRPARERVWTAAARFEAVLTTAPMDEAARNAWCRAERGVPEGSGGLATKAPPRRWPTREEARASPNADASRTGAGSRSSNANCGARTALWPKTAALLVLSKKVEAIFNKGEDE